MKSQKPIDYDVHLKYLCPKCGQEHWLSFNEASTKGFKIVCFCKEIFKPKRVSKFKLAYDNREEKKKETKQKEIKSSKGPLTEQILKACIDNLVKYGFSNAEAQDAIIQSHAETNSNDVVELVKHAFFGVKNHV